MKQISTCLVSLLALGVGSAAWAQPEEDPPLSGLEQPEDSQPAPEPEPEPEPAPEPEPEPVRTADNGGTAASTSAEAGEPDYGSRRPEGLSMGIGFGYDLPADLTVPNITSIRFRLPTGLTFEPFVELSNSTSSMEVAGIDTKNADTTVEAGTNIRIPIAEHGPLDFIIQAGAALSFNVDDPDGADNSTNTTLAVATWGVGLNWWVYRHISVSLTGTNPFVLINHINVDQPGANTKQTDVVIGAIFEPNVILMGHLYY